MKQKTRSKPPLRSADDVEEILDGLAFSAEDIVGAAASQALGFRKAAEFRIKCLRELNRAKSAYDSLKASTAATLRAEAAESGARTTENAIAEALQIDPDVSDALAEKNIAEEQDEYSRLLIDAYRMRRDSIRVIADMVHYNIGANTEGGQSTDKKMIREAARRRYE